MSHPLTFREWFKKTAKEVKLPRSYSLKMELDEQGELYYNVSNRRMISPQGKIALIDHLQRIIDSLEDGSE